MGGKSHRLSLAESGAVALDNVAAALDSADDLETLLDALERNRRVWNAIQDIGRREGWDVPSGRQTAFVLGTISKAAVSDDEVHALAEVSRSVSEALVGNAIDRIRKRAYFLWERKGRPHGQALDFWLLAEMTENKGRHH
jgi:hypothetical protein